MRGARFQKGNHLASRILRVARAAMAYATVRVGNSFKD
jgi:hypothetical protein